MDRKELLRHFKGHLTGEFISAVSPQTESVPLETTSSPKSKALQELETKCRKCRKCGLYQTAKNLVFSDGSPDAELVFIGEAPGADEDEQGKPFVGRAGKLLTATIAELGLKRQDVYICNILKHRPPDNRQPLPEEISACTHYLTEQLSILRPKLIITLGNFSTRFILNTEEGITKIRGRIHESPLGYKVLPTYHPAAILRNMNLIGDLKSDILEAIKFLKG